MARNTGKRPHELTLELFAQKATLTPTEIDDYVKNGAYSSKHIWFLRKMGYDISVARDGRTVVSYTFNGIGTATPAAPKPAKVAAVKAPKAPKPEVSPTDETVAESADPAPVKPVKVAKVKAPKSPKAPKVVKTPEEIREIKEANLETIREVAARLAAFKPRRDRDEVESELGTTGEVATSFSIDGDFDSVEGLNMRDLINVD